MCISAEYLIVMPLSIHAVSFIKFNFSTLSFSAAIFKETYIGIFIRPNIKAKTVWHTIAKIAYINVTIRPDNFAEFCVILFGTNNTEIGVAQIITSLLHVLLFVRIRTNNLTPPIIYHATNRIVGLNNNGRAINLSTFHVTITNRAVAVINNVKTI